MERIEMSKRRVPALAELRFAERRREFDGLGLAERFDLIYRTNLWGGEQSSSGLGSGLEATATLRRELSQLLQRLGVRTILDLPCGDFTWMAHTDLNGITYFGADIVPAIVSANSTKHGAVGRINFCCLNLVADRLPPVDLILCRDCLVHLSFKNIHHAIANVKRSGARWLLATTFPGIDENLDIDDGDWRALNFRYYGANATRQMNGAA
jgi:hypothetical protein